ncbi:MAG: Plasmid stabilization system protein [Bacteroidetes bacterium]|nr:Plasmid stabilization system protein [Bacteroidota bacterium]
MSFSFLFSSRAGRELADAWEWYETRQTGLGYELRQVIEDTIIRIQSNPVQFPQKRKPYREAKVDRFPYLIIYRTEKKNKLILILSVFHTSRNPRRKYRFED